MKKNEVFSMVDEMFPNLGYNCAQTVLICTSKYFGIDNHILKDISAPFGGGLCGIRVSVCGAISGGIMFIGIKEDGDKTAAGRELLEFVEGKYGSLNCNKILDIDFNNEEQVKKEKGEKLKSICNPLVKDICSWLIDRYDKVR